MASPREHGLVVGRLAPGRRNTIADVAGVRVGHVTVIRDEPAPPAGRGVARTGVTAIVPPALPAPAGVAVLNGAGEMTGSLQVREWGCLETPVYLTATMAVGRVYDGAVAAAVAADPRVGDEDVLIPVVAECDDSWLSDARVVQVEAPDAGRALERASSAFARGAVGAGTGMVCFGCKGGIGTASRVSGSSWTVGALVLANFGERAGLRIGGVAVGAALATPVAGARAAGSCIAVIATDAPLAPAALERVARRAGLGLARMGSVAHHGSGEIFLAFSTAPAPSAMTGPELDGVFEATVDATEEAVLDALWSAEAVTGRDGRTAAALPHDAVLALLGGSR